MLVFYCGHPSQGNELLKPLRALKPQEDNVRVMPYREAQAAAFLPAPIANFQTDLFLPELTEAAIAAIMTATNDASPNTKAVIVRAAYGPDDTRLVEIKKKYDPKNVLQLN